MAMNAALLPEYDHEMGVTRLTLERLPEDKYDWRPHPKSMLMGHLATHLANIPMWAAMTVNADDLDLAPGGKPMEQPPSAKSRAELLELFDKNVAAGRAAIAGADDKTMMSNWSLKNNGATLMTLPKVAVLRTWVMNHAIHHRAQLGVYLRLNDVAVPSVYGPSADEGQM
jgi:uncharacterized damage-inducible protein DinB